MKKMILALTFFSLSTAMADHSLEDAMNDQANIQNVVATITARAGVVCALSGSMQMEPASYIQSEDAWRQVAICFKSYTQLENFLLPNSNQFGGIYGVQGKAILDVTYDFSTGTVYSATLK